MTAVNQHIDAREIGAAVQVFLDQIGPGGDLGFGGGGVAVAGHVDDVEVAAAVEEDQFLRAPRRARGARQRLARGQRIDQARFADIGAAGESDLGAAHFRQRTRRRRGGKKLPVAGEQLAAGFDLVAGVVVCGHGRRIQGFAARRYGVISGLFAR